MSRNWLWLIFSLISVSLSAQVKPKELKAQHSTSFIKIDGSLDEADWKNATPATQFVEWRPTYGRIEDDTTKTSVYIVYDNTSIYIAGHCYERSRDSVSKELVGRDLIGVSDYVGVIFDTYNDKINAVGFYVTPYGEQFDAKYSNTGEETEDGSWNAVWQSAARVHDNGWSFEMRIPYSALRFSNSDIQTWGLNITRRRQKTGQQYMWNPVDPTVNGFVNQEGLWTGIEKIHSPLRLSFSPYFSSYLNHYPNEPNGSSNWTSSINGGMDVKYGITEGITLDMTLIPDFGQVQSDNHVLNLTPFEVRYNENRSFFTEGTELFNKGDLFYSRRIGGQPIGYYSVQDTTTSSGTIHEGEFFRKNPTESKLINATKISGRTKHGLGIGLFNAITKPMYAELIDQDTKERRKVLTNPLTNYNIVVLDQTLKNNSSVSLINTNVTRRDGYYDANVSAALFDINNKQNTYKVQGKFAVSQLYGKGFDKSVGLSRQLFFGKTGGNFIFSLLQDAADEKYDVNDMGILFNNNFLDHYLRASYRWQKATTWYNRIQLNFNSYHSTLYHRVPNQLIGSKFQVLTTNVNGNIQFKNLWGVAMFFGYVPKGNDFYEPRTAGYSFRTPSRVQLNPTIETNQVKKYFLSLDYFVGIRSLFNSPNHVLTMQQRYRFSDKFSITEALSYNPAINDAGYYGKFEDNGVMEDILFSRRDLKTVENILSFKYNFNSTSGIAFRARHYWSKVEPKQLYDLQLDGSLRPTTHAGVEIKKQNINYFNIDAIYTWQFAPGSFLNIAWKEQSVLGDNDTRYSYFRNIDRTLSSPQNNNLSIKVIYYLDYIDFKKWGRRRHGK